MADDPLSHRTLTNDSIIPFGQFLCRPIILIALAAPISSNICWQPECTSDIEAGGEEEWHTLGPPAPPMLVQSTANLQDYRTHRGRRSRAHCAGSVIASIITADNRRSAPKSSSWKMCFVWRTPFLSVEEKQPETTWVCAAFLC